MATVLCQNPQISINVHSSVRIAGAAGVVYVDPFEIENAPADAALVLVTHSHYDHLDPESIRAVAAAGTWFAAPAESVDALVAAGAPAERVVSVSPGESYEIAGFAVEVVAAYNLNKNFHPRDNQWVGYVVESDGRRVYVCGDTDNTPEARGVVCDIVCVPVGGTYTTTAEEAADLVAAMNPAPLLAIPEHYGSVAGDKAAGVRFGKELAARVGRAVEVALPY